jgi:hypothetical protein
MDAKHASPICSWTPDDAVSALFAAEFTTGWAADGVRPRDLAVLRPCSMIPRD